MAKQGLYLANGKGCRSYLKGHINDDRGWHIISDENDLLRVSVSYSGLQQVRYESGWKEEHKVEAFSRSISYAHTIKREWMSQVTIAGDNLKFWDDEMVGDDNLSTFQVQHSPDDVWTANGGVYCTGVFDHEDINNKPRSALLIVHNDGFAIGQSGLSQDHPVGKIVILHTHETHSLIKIRPDAQRWAAVFLDYEADLSLEAIEESLKTAYRRVFQRE